MLEDVEVAEMDVAFSGVWINAHPNNLVSVPLAADVLVQAEDDNGDTQQHYGAHENANHNRCRGR